MFKADVSKTVPWFIRNDKNGRALAKALEAGAQMMNDVVAQGVGCIVDYDGMPEWRLDELAWETNCLYDYNAGIDEKRKWIKSATPWYQAYGTPLAVKWLISVALGGGELLEWFEYGGEPYHFKIVAASGMDEGMDEYFYKMLLKVKNVRSQLDGIHANCVINKTLHSGAAQVSSMSVAADCGTIEEVLHGGI